MKEGVHIVPEEEIRQRLGRSIRAARSARSMTQEAVAARSGMGWRHLQKIEAGEVNVTLRTICRVATALGVDPSALLCVKGSA